jgi:hypothetical protein
VELVEGAGDGDGASLPVQNREQLTKRCYELLESEFVNLFKEPRNRFPDWRAGTTNLFEAPNRQATQAGGIDSWAL